MTRDQTQGVFSSARKPYVKPKLVEEASLTDGTLTMVSGEQHSGQDVWRWAY